MSDDGRQILVNERERPNAQRDEKNTIDELENGNEDKPDIVTASFIPVEIYELIRHVSAPTIIVLTVNIASVIYLVWELMPRTCKSHT